jgi:hypothetical protein
LEKLFEDRKDVEPVPYEILDDIDVFSSSDPSLEAVLLPHDTSEELLTAVNVMAGTAEMTERTLRVMLYLQWQNDGRY